MTLYAAWSVPALLTGLSAFAIRHAADPTVELGRTLFQQFWYYGLFASICPVVYRVNAKLPFNRGAWPRAVTAHVALGLAVTIGTMVVSAVVDVLVEARDRTIPNAIVVELTTPSGQLRGFVNAFYYVMVAGAMALILSDRRRRQQEERAGNLATHAATLEAQFARARLKALEMQLNPHFLFNALNGIASLVEQRRNDDAYRAIVLLGDLLRETLELEGRSTVPLRQEIELLDKYLALERLRFGDRLRTEVHVPEACADAAVPAMILQPLVENAIRHAVAVETGPCAVVISATLVNGSLQLEVLDDGPGLPGDGRIEGTSGLGLENVRQRLDALYGDEAELRLENAETRGLRACIVLPHRSSHTARAVVR